MTFIRVGQNMLVIHKNVDIDVVYEQSFRDVKRKLMD